MEEKNNKQCKVCGLIKERILVGKFGEQKRNKKWSDSTGKLWNGHVCPDCHKAKAKENMRKFRAGS